jgi:hypothetical protein
MMQIDHPQLRQGIQHTVICQRLRNTSQLQGPITLACQCLSPAGTNPQSCISPAPSSTWGGG